MDIFGREVPGVSYTTSFSAPDGTQISCVPIDANELGDIERVRRPYGNGYHVAVRMPLLTDEDRSLAVLLLRKVAAGDEGEVFVDGDACLVVHPWRPPDGGDAGDRAPRPHVPPHGTAELKAPLPGE